jgi:2-polyprenyl-3-methyl-5-hydroxy-6-metoxy-1,4-benzoquinol methylase
MYSENDKSFHADYFESVFKYGNILNKGSYERQCREYEMVYGDVLPDDKNAKVLDVGCGIGHFLYYLKKRGYKNFCGIDISPQQVNFCKENISERVEVADAFDFLKVGREKYSVIVAHDVLEHIRKEKTLTLLRLIYDSLENGGDIDIAGSEYEQSFFT